MENSLLLEHALFVGIGAALTFLTTYFGTVDWGAWTPLVVAGFATATAYVASLIAGSEPPPAPPQQFHYINRNT